MQFLRTRVGVFVGGFDMTSTSAFLFAVVLFLLCRCGLFYFFFFFFLKKFVGVCKGLTG
jgi:hypothetical protein